MQGYETGASVFLGFLAVGAFFAGRHCLRVAKRPTAQTLCVQGLAFVFWSLCLAFVLAATRRHVELPTLVAFIAGCCVFGLLFTAIFLALMGLRDVAKNRGRYRQGVAQAVWAMVLSLGVIGGTAVLVAARDRRAQRPEVDPSNRRLAREGEFERFEDFSFGFVSPGPRWWLMDRDKEAPWTKLEYRLAPEEAISVFVRAVRLDWDVTLADAVAHTKRPPEGTSTRKSFRVDYACKINNLHGHALEFDIESDEAPRIFCLMWICVYDNVIYEVACVGRPSNEQQLRTEAQSMWERFYLLDS